MTARTTIRMRSRPRTPTGSATCRLRIKVCRRSQCRAGDRDGKYAIFLDADDLLMPMAAATLTAAAADREDVLCIGGYQTFIDENNHGHAYLPAEPPDVLCYLWRNAASGRR